MSAPVSDLRLTPGLAWLFADPSAAPLSLDPVRADYSALLTFLVSVEADVIAARSSEAVAKLRAARAKVKLAMEAMTT